MRRHLIAVELRHPDVGQDDVGWLLVDELDRFLAIADRDDANVLVITGAGDSWTAGMDLKEYFRATDGK